MTSDDDAALLAAYRLADSFLPVGSNTISYGLEAFVESGRVSDADDLQNVLEGYLRGQIGPAETVAVRTSHAVAPDLDAVARVDDALHVSTLNAEFRESATRSGRRLLEVETETGDDPVVAAYEDRVATTEAPGNYPVAFGLVTARHGASARAACLGHAHAFVTALLGAAQRLLSLGHVAAQRLLRELSDVVVNVVDANADRGMERIEPYAPLVDIHSMDHERADRRLFIS